MIQVHHAEASALPYPDDHFDCLVTDPPYGYGFMGKDWDKAVVPASTWNEVLRVMKPGAFGFVMSAPRQDVLARMIVNLQEAGFETGFTSIYWAYATGFPKAGNIGKMVDKRLGVEREVVGVSHTGSGPSQIKLANHGPGDTGIGIMDGSGKVFNLTSPASPLAKSLDGSYAGFQPKPAVEVILVVMKPLTEKGYLDQAMKDGKGVTWLEAGRIPYDGEVPNMGGRANAKMGGDQDYGFKVEGRPEECNIQGRFPANLLVSDDVLDDGSPIKKPGKCYDYTGAKEYEVEGFIKNIKPGSPSNRGDTGTFSRYFDLDAWWEALPESARKTFPFLVVPKPSKAEKGKDCKHPTVKPVKLMSYLIAIGSRPGDLILDPFMGSGTTLVAAKTMGRRAVGVDNDGECIPVAEARVKAANRGLF